MKNNIQQIIEEELSILDLTPREKEILRLRAKGKTLKEVGDKLNLTMERIRQIQEKAKERKISFLKVVKKITKRIKRQIQ